MRGFVTAMNAGVTITNHNKVIKIRHYFEYFSIKNVSVPFNIVVINILDTYVEIIVYVGVDVDNVF